MDVDKDIDTEVMPPPSSPKKVIEPSPDNHSVKTSESGPVFLKQMLRIEIEFPTTKVVNLIEEFTDYLEETGLQDE